MHFLLAQDLSFPAKQVLSHLDAICPTKSAPKPKLSNLSSFDDLTCVEDFSQMVVPNPVKLFPLENKIFKISYDSRIIKFGPEARELLVIQFDPTAVRMH